MKNNDLNSTFKIKALLKNRQYDHIASHKYSKNFIIFLDNAKDKRYA